MNPPSSKNSHVSPWQIGVRAARANLIPGLVLQAVAVAVVLAYYHWAGFHGVLNHLAAWQERYGILFSMIVRVVANGFIPALFCAAVPGLQIRRPGAGLAFLVGWWAFMGANTHWFYHFQAWLWGTEPALRTVLGKTATDMLIYSPFYASPITAIAHLWQDQNYSWRATRLQLGTGWYRRVVLPNQVPGWAFWTPCLLGLYSLPVPLQIPMAAVLGCFWALMCLQIARRTPLAALPAGEIQDTIIS